MGGSVLRSTEPPTKNPVYLIRMERRTLTQPLVSIVVLRHDSPVPLFRQLYYALRDGIIAGQLAAGTRLPSTRLLALDLGVARITVQHAYEQLVIEGYADQAAYEAHLATPHFLKYKAETAGMVKSLRLIETDPIALRAKDRISK